MVVRDDLIAALASPDLETRVRALEVAAKEDPEAYASLAVQQIAAYPRDGYFVLERIGRFGRAAVPHLRTLKATTTNSEVLLLAILALAHFKELDTSDTEPLISAIHTRSEYQNLACLALSYVRAVSAGPALLDELRATEPSERDRLTCLVPAIRQLGFEIPSNDVHRLTPPRTPPWITSLFSAGETPQ